MQTLYRRANRTLSLVSVHSADVFIGIFKIRLSNSSFVFRAYGETLAFLAADSLSFLYISKYSSVGYTANF